MRELGKYVKKYTGRISLGVFLKLLAAGAELLIPYVLEHLIDNVAPRENVTEIILYGLVMVVLAFAVRETNVRANRMGASVSKDCIYEIRRDLFEKSMSLSGKQTDEVGLPSLISRMTSDSYNIQNFLRAAQAMGIRAPMLLLGGIIVTFTMDTGLALILAIMAPVLIALVVFVSFKGIPLYKKVQSKVDDIVRVMRENITGIRVVKALSKEDYERNRYRRVNDDLTKTDIFASIVMSLPGPLMQLFLNGGLTLVVYVGAIRVNAGVTKPGVILAFLTYFNMVIMGVMGLNSIFMMMSRANASAGRIFSIINLPEDLVTIPESEGAKTDRTGYIVFDHVDYSYNKYEEGAKDEISGEDRQKTLYDIDFEFKKGGSLVIIGATGAGKTTIF
ncbi:MAG: ABC transporter ATP-binding protein, partial [Lachnospiraceae bacterium]|nr:ABC transporter ATP-binding protein [Lachnospiraceae bacterium]